MTRRGRQSKREGYQDHDIVLLKHICYSKMILDLLTICFKYVIFIV